MRIEKVAMIGTRGHYRTVLREMEAMPALRVVGLAAGGDSIAPIKEWCREHGHAPQTYDDHRAMLDRARPDVLVICGPFEAHAARRCCCCSQLFGPLAAGPGTVIG